MKDRSHSRYLQVISIMMAFMVFMTAVFALPVEVSVAASGAKRTASLSLIRQDGKRFDFREAAGERLYGYDTLQGVNANVLVDHSDNEKVYQ